ncbi:uncharacterized protein LOC113006328 [Solenopsis invicta]|uniref:uncharacterized protein LOC113006328 n=1 Tax=Solenopsis invicta TaxID=13686 RepID=UPI00193C92F7|nr:uncharacterized protein LOC113006328 [Solenopsis invicta]
MSIEHNLSSFIKLKLNYFNFLETHLHKTDCNTAIQIDTANKENIAQNFESTAHNNLIENIDEDLIATVKERPALYDYRIPVKERGRKQKNHLWQEVSDCLKGFYSAAEAEKKGLYLKDCNRKARNTIKKKESFVQKSGAADLPKTYEIKPSFRHYNAMTFLNDTLEYRQTVTSLKKSVVENQVSNIPSTSNATSNDNFDNFDDNGTLISDDNYTSISSVSPTASTSKKKKRINAEDYEEALLHSLTKPCEPNPIDGFVSRLVYTCETAFVTYVMYLYIITYQ